MTTKTASKQLVALHKLRKLCSEEDELVVALYNRTNNNEVNPDAVWAGIRRNRRNQAGLVVRVSFKEVTSLLYLPGELTSTQRSAIELLGKQWAEKFNASFLGVCKPTKSHVFFHAPEEIERDPSLKLVDFLLSLVKDNTWEKQVAILSCALEKLLGKPDYEDLLLPRNGDVAGYIKSKIRILEASEEGIKIARRLPAFEEEVSQKEEPKCDANTCNEGT